MNIVDKQSNELMRKKAKFVSELVQDIDTSKIIIHVHTSYDPDNDSMLSLTHYPTTLIPREEI